MIQISVIVPIYNKELYLSECLESLTLQGFTKDNAEVLLINDGSTDNSKEIAEKYCKKYSYFCLINKENGGLVSARNCGLERASGKFISFIDADDSVASNIYFPIINQMEKKNIEGIYFGSTRQNETLNCCEFFFYEVDRKHSIKQSVCTMIYRREIIFKNNICFDNHIQRYCEDFLFNFKYVMNCKGIILGNSQPLYFYRVTADSITDNIAKQNKDNKHEYYKSTLYVCSEIKRYALMNNKQNDPAYKKSLSQAIMIFLWGAMIFKINPNKTLRDLKINGTSSYDIKNMAFEGNGLKYKIKTIIEFLFRFKMFYIISCHLYRIIKRN